MRMQKKVFRHVNVNGTTYCCKERNVLVSGTIGILKAACLDGILEIDQADQMLSQMIVNVHPLFYERIKIMSIFA